MAALPGQKQRQQEFHGISIAQPSSSSSSSPPLSSSSSSISGSYSSPTSGSSSSLSTSVLATARFKVDDGGAQLQFHQKPGAVISVNIQNVQLFKLGPVESMCISEGSECNKIEVLEIFHKFLVMVETQFEKNVKVPVLDLGGQYILVDFQRLIEEKGMIHRCSCLHAPQRIGIAEREHHHIMEMTDTFLREFGAPKSFWKSYARAITIGFRTEEESEAFHYAFEQWKNELFNPESGTRLENGSVSASNSKFSDKIEAASAKMYFHYYGQLLHQQNMLQDYVRTGTYYAAVIENRVDFNGRVVVDVGAGSGILSLFAAQAGAKHVYAVEASDMVEYARRLIAGNPLLGQRITVVKGKVEEVELPEKADILISEPMGTLLVNERMLESYVIARDRFLVPNGKMFPTIGRIHMAPFSDEYLYVEIANKALFWQQQNYFGVNLTPLYGSAFEGYFAQPVVDAFDPRLLVAPAIFHTLDFTTIKEEELYEFEIPLSFIASVGTRVHGLACWFDVLFNGSAVQRWLTTAPGTPTTHWYQLRCVLSQPLYVMAGQEITGQLHMVAHSAQSYTMYLTMSAKMWGAGAEQGGILQTSSGRLDLKEPYYRMSQPQAYVGAQDQQPHQLIHPQETALQSQEVFRASSMQQLSQNSGAVTHW